MNRYFIGALRRVLRLRRRGDRLDQIPVDRIREFELGFLTHLDAKHPQVLADLREKKALDDDLKKGLTTAFEEYKSRF